MKQVEEQDEYTRNDQQQQYNDPEIWYQIITTQNQVGSNQTGKHHYCAIQKQYAPVWQGLSREIPVDYGTKRIMHV